MYTQAASWNTAVVIKNDSFYSRDIKDSGWLEEDNKDDSQQDAAHEVAQGGEVGNGGVVRVDTQAPHPVYHHVGDVEKQANLTKSK